MQKLTDEQLHYTPIVISDEQMKQLEEIIRQSPNATDFGKRIIIWLLRQTNNLTRRVALSISENQYPCDSREELRMSASGLKRDGGPFQSFLKELETEVGLSDHGGCLVNGKYLKGEDQDWSGITIWFSQFMYDQLDGVAILEPPPIEELRAIALW